MRPRASRRRCSSSGQRLAQDDIVVAREPHPSWHARGRCALGRREPVKASGPTLMAVFEQHLPSGAASVAVLCGPEQNAVVRRIRARHPELEVVAVPSTLSRSERHVRLTVAGPFDLILDAATTRKGRSARFQDAFFQLRPGGVYVVRRAGEVLGEGASSGLGEVLQRAFARAPNRARYPGAARRGRQ